MPYAKHTTDPPPFDAKAANEAFKTLRKPDGAPYSVFTQGGFHAVNRYLLGIGEFDGTGLKDVVEANAFGLDLLKTDVDKHKSADDSRHAVINQRLAAIEARLADSPFPG